MNALTPKTIPDSASAQNSVLIVDDSRTSRAFIETVINGQPDLRVVGSVFSGEKALAFLRTTTPDVVTLDVEMPGIGGLATLEQIQQINAGLPRNQRIGVLMVSAYTLGTAEVTQAALRAGAYDFVTKPSTQIDDRTPLDFRHDLIVKLRQYLQRRSCGALVSAQPVRQIQSDPSMVGCAPSGGGRTVAAVLIGASTGGPKALAELLPALTAAIDAPILIVQHLPVGFTRSLAENLQRRTDWPVHEAEHEQVILPRNIYVAPGGRHLTVAARPSGKWVSVLTDDPPESGCRPSASVLFRSAATAFGAEAMAIILTGMGNDGTTGLCDIRRQGGYVIAQDEASSVVWGMPGSAVAAGAAQRVLPLDLMAAHVAAMTRESRGV
ncbi:MAG: chemotaxis-specific protein-glutamate methyltransferase CheB [Methylococcaceae bacterium]|jgi:two-component system chemotaxis response regulator CheB